LTVAWSRDSFGFDAGIETSSRPNNLRHRRLGPYDLHLVDGLRCAALDRHVFLCLYFLHSGSLALCCTLEDPIRDDIVISSPLSGSPLSSPGFTTAQPHLDLDLPPLSRSAFPIACYC